MAYRAKCINKPSYSHWHSAASPHTITADRQQLMKLYAKNILKNNRIWPSHFTLCRAGHAGPIFTIFGMWGHMADVITHVKYSVGLSVSQTVWLGWQACHADVPMFTWYCVTWLTFVPISLVNNIYGLLGNIGWLYHAINGPRWLID